ncbi:MAG: menH [Myxococcales bacterium]|nr:menH [Myxococcales bacterium]
MRCALVHGFLGDPHVWDDVVKAWAIPTRPVVVALPGHGGGPVQPTWSDNLQVIAGAIGTADVVIGYSLGARVALGLLAAGYYDRAILIGVNPGINEAERQNRREFDAAWARLLRTSGIGAFSEAWAGQPLFATQKRAPADRLEMRRSRRLRLDPEQLARSLEVMGLAGMPSYWSVIPAHRDRIALIAGADDTKYVAISETLPAASFETIAGSGHDPTLEQPALLAAAIARAANKLR